MLGSLDDPVTAEETSTPAEASTISRAASTSSELATIDHGGFLWTAHAVSGDIPPARRLVLGDFGILSNNRMQMSVCTITSASTHTHASIQPVW